MRITTRCNMEFDTDTFSADVSAYLDAAARKEENLRHQQRRHWDYRGFHENIIVWECSHNDYETPEQWYLRKETLVIIKEALASCTKTQRKRFLLFAMNDLSYAEIAKQEGCSKYAVRDSIQAVRKKIRIIL